MNLVKLAFIIISTLCFAQDPFFYTTKLTSTAGAGVGALWVHEAAVLNPASITFTPISSVYYQRGTVESEQDTGSKSMYLLTDTSSALKGTLSYQKSVFEGFERSRFSSSFSSNIGQRSSLGLIYNYSTDQQSPFSQDKNHKVDLGVIHIFSPVVTVGLAVKDLFKDTASQATTTIGAQVKLFRSIFFLQDFRFNQFESFSKTMTTLSALQILAFEDLYIRAGIAQNGEADYKATSYGISWLSPKLGIEYARMSEKFDNKDIDRHALTVLLRY